jgi:hypothetical protein
MEGWMIGRMIKAAIAAIDLEGCSPLQPRNPIKTPHWTWSRPNKALIVRHGAEGPGPLGDSVIKASKDLPQPIKRNPPKGRKRRSEVPHRICLAYIARSANLGIGTQDYGF